MKWAAESAISVLTFVLLRTVWFILRVARVCNRALRPRYALVLSKGDFSIVIWPTSPAILSPLQASLLTNTARLSTWFSHRFRRSQKRVPSGKAGEAVGPVQTPFTSNSPAPPLEHNDKVN